MIGLVLVFAGIGIIPVPAFHLPPDTEQVARVEVTIALGRDPLTRRVRSDLTAPWDRLSVNSLVLRKIAQDRHEIDFAATLKVLSEDEGGLLPIPRPAVRIGRGKWFPVDPRDVRETGSAVRWIRLQLDPWWRDREIARRQRVFEEACEAFYADCKDNIYSTLPYPKWPSPPPEYEYDLSARLWGPVQADRPLPDHDQEPR